MSGIEIQELVLRLPGVAPWNAAEVADEIARALSARLARALRTGAVHLARVVISVRPGAGRAELVDRVVEALEGALQ